MTKNIFSDKLTSGFVIGEYTKDPEYIEHIKFTSKGKVFSFPVDIKIKDTIILLNKKGYKTDNSCQGHEERGISTYVSFKKKPSFYPKLPGPKWINEPRISRGSFVISFGSIGANYKEAQFRIARKQLLKFAKELQYSK